jgi:biopolymer transport protein ExbD
MRINQSAIAANPFEKHLINRRRQKGKAMRSPQFALMLTSMVDMFSMLVIFLLQTFSNSPEMTIVKGMQLPKAMTASIVREAPILAISLDGNLYLDQKLVGKTTDVTAKPEELLSKLNFIKKGWVASHKSEFSGDINLQADREIESTTVSMIMGILTTSQFQSIQLAVIGK